MSYDNEYPFYETGAAVGVFLVAAVEKVGFGCMVRIHRNKHHHHHSTADKPRIGFLFKMKALLGKGDAQKNQNNGNRTPRGSSRGGGDMVGLHVSNSTWDVRIIMSNLGY